MDLVEIKSKLEERGGAWTDTLDKLILDEQQALLTYDKQFKQIARITKEHRVSRLHQAAANISNLITAFYEGHRELEPEYVLGHRWVGPCWAFAKLLKNNDK